MSVSPRPTARQRIWLFIFLLSLPVTLSAASSAAQLTNNEKQRLQREARLVIDLLQNLHYSGRAFRDIENKEIVTRCIEELDPAAAFFTSEDSDYLHRRFDRTLKSVYLFRGDLQPAFEIFDLFHDRARTRLAWVQQLLEQPLDLATPDTLADSPKPALVKAGAEMDQRWLQRLKDQVIDQIIAGRTPPAAQAVVAKRYAEIGRIIAAADSFAIRERFFDAVIRSFDAHSGYFSADSAREFSVDMANAVTGVGLDLRKEGGRCVVAAVQPGGPAEFGSTIAPGDALLAAAEGDGPWVDFSFKRLREVVALLRGKAGDKVRLAYQPGGSGERTEVTLERARVVLTQGRAHGAISEVPDPAGHPRKIGWITLPDFYAGGEGPDATSATRDVRGILEPMIAAGIEGLVIDLRLNPGGAMTEASALSQLFLPGGDIMLTRSADGQIAGSPLKTQPPLYPGPLVVLTSAQSASASEIFSGAMKFHQRALIVGDIATFGKGSAQAYISLSTVPGVDAKAAADWGTLRLTGQQFFLPNGQAVQQTGVPSHIVLPTFTPPGLKREVDLPHALPPETITRNATPQPPAPGQSTVTATLLDHLRACAAADFAQLPEWALWHREQAYTQANYERWTRSLLLTEREAAFAKLLTEFQANQRERRTLGSAHSFPTLPLETPAVQALLDQHETRLRALRPSDGGDNILHHLRNGAFYLETDSGHLRAVRLEHVEPVAYLGDSDALAAAFSTAAGHTLAPADIIRLLQAYDRLDPVSEPALFTAARQIIGDAPSDADLRRGLEAMLLKITELDTDYRRARPGFDIPLREAQRLAAAWAAWPPPNQ